MRPLAQRRIISALFVIVGGFSAIIAAREIAGTGGVIVVLGFLLFHLGLRLQRDDA